MASQGTSLRFTVEVAADQATNALKAMTLAFDQAGVKAKASLSGIGSGSRQAAGGVAELKQGMGRARETAMFFTQSLQAFGPAGQMAQKALSGIGGAILGGGGILLALEGARLAIDLLTDAWAADAKAAEEAASKNLAAGKAIADAAAQRARSASAEAEKAYYGEREAAARNFREELKKLNALIADAKRRTGDDVESQEVKKLVAERAALIKSMQEELAARRQLEEIASVGRVVDKGIEEREKVRRASEKAAADAQKAKEARDRAGQAALDARARAYESVQRAEIEGDQRAAQEGQRALDARARAYESAARERQRSMEAEQARYQQLGDTVGTVMGQLITGQMTFGQAVQQVGQMIVQTVVKTAIANITAKAYDAGAGAAASQSNIPVIGPVLGIAAMGAMISAVLALIGNMPSAAGGWKVPYDTLAMVHEDERILPARYSKGLDRMVEGGGAGGVTVNITATDAKGVRRLFLDNTGALAEAIGRAVRDGRRFD